MELTYRTGRHCVFVLHCHLIFITRYRGKVFNAAQLATLERIIRNVCGQFECEVVDFNEKSDHVHMLLNFPPKVAISKLVNRLKGASSRRMKLHHPELHKPASEIRRALVAVLFRWQWGRCAPGSD